MHASEGQMTVFHVPSAEWVQLSMTQVPEYMAEARHFLRYPLLKDYLVALTFVCLIKTTAYSKASFPVKCFFMGLDAPSLKLVGHGQFKRVNPKSDVFKVGMKILRTHRTCVPSRFAVTSVLLHCDNPLSSSSFGLDPSITVTHIDHSH